MTAPEGARDGQEGYCSGCDDWKSWDDLEPCSTCETTLCPEHRYPEDHQCHEGER